MSTTPIQEETLPTKLGSGLMFDRIARRYDRLNRIMSLGMDRRWRRHLIRAVGPIPERGKWLDVAAGTGDVAIMAAKTHPNVEVIGLDPSEEMMRIGASKAARHALESRVSFVPGDAQALPYADDTFDAVTIAFGIRNVPDRAKGLSEMARVCRPGARVGILELSEPRRGLLSPFARFYVHHIVPRLGALISGAREYRYLQESIAAFPPPETFREMMHDAGLANTEARAFMLKGVVLYVGTVT
mgnify:CR=1 FL=1